MSNQHGTVAVGKCSAIVVYDRKSGDIVHVHECWVEKGVRSPSKASLAREAMAHAREGRDLKPRSVALIHVDPKKVIVSDAETLHVDVKRKRLKRVPILRARRPIFR